MQTVRLGLSVEDRPIEMTVFGESGPLLLVMGGFHGNEPTSVDLARAFIAYLREHPEVTADCRVAVIPVVNPDGLYRGTRHNARDVDINRNFPASNFPANPRKGFAGGPYPGSERETRLVMSVLRKWQPAKIISIHSIARCRHGNNYDGPGRRLAEEMSRYNRYPVLASMGYPTPGSFGTWAGVDQQIPTITLELPRDASAEQVWQENREALLAAVRFPVMAWPATSDRMTAVGK